MQFVQNKFLHIIIRVKKLTPTKIEKKALLELENIIENHELMHCSFNDTDKEMAWDGFILLYEKNIEKKENIKARIPVQIKGRSKNNRCGKNKIHFGVSLDDLKAYSSEKGVLYFIVKIDEKGGSDIYYSSLFPSKILSYIKSARKKNVSIVFNKMRKDAQTMYRIVSQFDFESRLQGSTDNPLVKNMILLDQYKQIKEIRFDAKNIRNPILPELVRALSSGDICLYGFCSDDKYPRPIEWKDGIRVNIQCYENREIYVADKLFYNKVRWNYSDKGTILILSENLSYDFNSNKILFKMKTNLECAINDALFLLEIEKVHYFSIEKAKIQFIDSITEEFKNMLLFLISTGKVLSKINLPLDIKLSEISDLQLKQITLLLNISSGEYNNMLKEKFVRYDWDFGDKFVPLIIKKGEKENNLINIIHSKELNFIIYSNTNGTYYNVPMSMFYRIPNNVLANLYHYEETDFYYQLDNSDINQTTSSIILNIALQMINVFDINADTFFLNFAEVLLNKVEALIPSSIYLLNILQINKRRHGLLTEKEILQLHETHGDIYIEFGKNVLNGNKQMAKSYFDQFPQEIQQNYVEYPIYTLYKNLFINKT